MGVRRTKDEDVFTERSRAEDIILGSLGYGEDARLISIAQATSGFRGTGRWLDGEEFSFEHDDELDEVEHWALGILLKAPDLQKP